MTNYTNNQNLPEMYVRAVTNDPYTKGDADISVSGLLEPPQKRVITNQNRDSIVTDVADRFYAVQGQATHAIMERAAEGNDLGHVEKRLYADVNGWRVSGQPDLITYEGEVWDWKNVSAYELMNGIKPERVQQLNMYAYLAEINDLPVKSVHIGYLFRDWTKRNAQRDARYPQHPVTALELPLWSWDERAKFVEARVELHQAAERGVIQPCSDEERWAKPAKWAVIKEGAKRAVKLFEDQAEANVLAASKGSGYVVEERKGENTRCELYCDAADYCPQFAALG